MKDQILKNFDSLMSHLNSEENSMAEEFREKLEGLFKTKTLYILVGDGGDGSYYPHYTFNEAYIDYLENNDTDSYSDGDGFHYDTVKVPHFYTLEMMGERDCAEDWEPEEEELEEEE